MNRNTEERSLSARESVRESSSDRSPSVCRNSQANEQGFVEVTQFFGRQFAHIISQSRLLKTHQSTALDRAFVLEAFGRAHGNLCR